MERRNFLKASSLGVAALVAGCGGDQGESGEATSGSGSNSSGNEGAISGTSGSSGSAAGGTSGGGGAEAPETTQSGPAEFADASIQGPTNVTVGEDFTLPVSVANTGGRNGTYSGTLTVAEGSSSFNRSVTIDGVAHEIAPGVAIFIPAEAEHGTIAGEEGLRFLYGFPKDRFADVDYRFTASAGESSTVQA